MRTSEQDRPDVAEARLAFICRQPALESDRLCSSTLPEPRPTWHGVAGRALCGLRLSAAVPQGHCKVTTVIAGLRTAASPRPAFRQATNGERFRNYVEQMWAPTLSRGLAATSLCLTI
jgi:hypothetical protein